MNNNEKRRIVSMNDEIYDLMFLEMLECRLETDPLLPGILYDLPSDMTPSCVGYDPNDSCRIFSECINVPVCPCHNTVLYD